MHLIQYNGTDIERLGHWQIYKVDAECDGHKYYVHTFGVKIGKGVEIQWRRMCRRA